MCMKKDLVKPSAKLLGTISSLLIVATFFVNHLSSLQLTFLIGCHVFGFFLTQRKAKMG